MAAALGRRIGIPVRNVLMERQYMSGGILLDRTDPHGRGATVPSWLSTDALPFFLAHTGDNGAGNGGSGYFAGSVVDDSYATFKPLNAAEAGTNAAADAYQSNIVNVDQAATQVAGVGGDGGNQNVALGGTVGLHELVGSEGITTGGNTAGNGGDGHFAGAMIAASAAVFDPINIAVAGSHAAADANQSNVAHFDQSVTQVAGVGGQGGNGNLAIGGDMSLFGSGHGLGHNSGGSDVIATGGNSAGNGGEGYFSGNVVHESFALYDPINIAIAGPNSSAQAVQTNNVDLNQSAFQMAGVGGHGGAGNTASGGNAAVSSGLGSFGSDVIAIGGNHAGDGGNGHFSGALVDVNIAIYAPINIAVAGYNSSATADQINSVHFDQSAIQIAGVGGDGGHGNLALGGDFTMQFLADHHLPGHVA
jgi:hypothetical protein